VIFPPSVLRIRRTVDGRRRRNLWLPLFLLWPLAAVLWLALLPLILIVALLTWRRGTGRVLLFGGPKLFRLFCALRGLRIDTEKDNEQFFMALW